MTIKLVISPETRLLELEGGGSWSAAYPDGMSAGQFADLEFPRCPVCDSPVEADRIDITYSAETEAAYGRRYIPGMWECPHGCDPVAMVRRHFSQSYERGIGYPGTKCTCTCGNVTMTMNVAEAVAWQDEHHRPDRRGPGT